MLGGFGFELVGSADIRQPGDVDIETVVAADVAPHLAQGLQEGQRLNISHSAANLTQHDLSPGGFRDLADAAFDHVGDVGDDLDGTSQVIAPPFPA